MADQQKFIGICHSTILAFPEGKVATEEPDEGYNNKIQIFSLFTSVYIVMYTDSWARNNYK